MASPAAAAARSGSGAPALLSLFRSILRLHRERLPPPMRAMGDTYVKSEFRRHLRGSTTEEQWGVFVAEWQRYAAMLGGSADQQSPAPPAPGSPQQAPDIASVTATIAGGSADMTEQLLTHLSPDQRRQLIKLQQEAMALGAKMLGRRSGGSSGNGDAQQHPDRKP
jgi:hypothetical protein